MNKSSRLKEFYKKNQIQKLKTIQNFSSLSDKEIALLKNLNSLDYQTANRMVENVVSTYSLPLGIATNFKINNKDYLIPMVSEEASVIAAASNGAKLARLSDGFFASTSKPIMIGQIQLLGIKNLKKAKEQIEKNKESIISFANKQDALLVKLGGGAEKLQTKILKTSRGQMLIVHLLVNVQDAMGANIIDTMLEKISPKLEKLTQGTTLLKIVSNLPIHRIAKASATWKRKTIGEKCIEGILDAQAFAQADPFRCVTHNKGIMNGIDAVAIACGNDFRAIEAGVHCFASLKKTYQPLTKYYLNEKKDLVGEIELPMPVGTVGGSIKTHPTAKIALKILNIKKSTTLAKIMASVGLAQNFAALKALTTTGIQQGHMKLHSKNIAILAGAKNEKIDLIAKKMVAQKNISVSKAKELLKTI
jgi:hydroxymethylglutaryl-CoA reductase